MTGNNRHPNIRQFAIDDMKVGSADTAGTHAHEHLSRTRLRHRSVACFENTPTAARQHHSPHAGIVVARLINGRLRTVVNACSSNHRARFTIDERSGRVFPLSLKLPRSVGGVLYRAKKYAVIVHATTMTMARTT